MDVIDIVGPRLPTRTWRRCHMYDESKMASSIGQKIREFYYEKQVLDILDGLTATNSVQLDFFEIPR